MRPLEVLLLIFVGIVFLRPIHERVRNFTYRAWYIVLGWIVILLHLLIEGARWQMVPVYGLITFFTIEWQITRRRAKWDIQPPKWHLVIGMLVFLLVLIPLVVFPLPNLIEPRGPYHVGTRTLYFQDNSREEIYSAKVDDKRELNVQVWYPAEEKDGAKFAPYMTDLKLSAPAYAQFLRLPSFVLNHVNLIDTHAFLDVPVTMDGAPHPVLIFSHGWGGTRTQSTYLMEELASHGYVVVAIDHTYGALVTVFPDDRVVMQKSDILQGHDSDEDEDLSHNPLLSIWSGDVSFILDQLEIMNSSRDGNILQDKLDLNRIGIMGHSTGGGNTVQVCAQDPRCKVGFVMDAWLMPVSRDALENGLDQPFMFLWSEDWGSDENKGRFGDLFGKIGDDVFNLEIEGTRHYDFSDLPLLSPLSPWFGLKGPIDGERVLVIINDYAVAFFDEYLIGAETDLLDGPYPDYPEVTFEKR